MSIVKTDAFILKSFKYGETSKIVTLFTKDFGKMNAIVKGARNYKSKLCGVFETMNYISVVIYLKENRELQLVSNAEYKKSFPNIINDFDKLQTAFRIIEILNRSLAEYEINHSIFDLLMNTYEQLNVAKENFYNYILFFQIHLIKYLGLSPDFSNLKNNFNSETFFDNSEFKLNKQQLEVLKLASQNNLEVKSLNIDKDESSKLSEIYEKYLLMNTTGSKFYKSNRVFKELEQYI